MIFFFLLLLLLPKASLKLEFVYGHERDDLSRVYQRIPISLRHLLVLGAKCGRGGNNDGGNNDDDDGGDGGDDDDDRHYLSKVFRRAERVEQVPGTPSAVVRYADPATAQEDFLRASGVFHRGRRMVVAYALFNHADILRWDRRLVERLDVERISLSSFFFFFF